MKAFAQLNMISNLVRRLARETDEVRKSEFFKAYLNTAAKFWRYSYRNQLLIMAQYPFATRVAGFRAWQEIGRNVKKGSKAIRILAPCTKKIAREEKEANEKPESILTYFVPVCVFDVSQTDGRPLPSFDVELEGSSQQWLLDSLLLYCKKLDIGVEFREFGVNNVYGYSKGGHIAINSRQSVNSQASTMVHEIAHELLHTRHSQTTRQVMEIQAEGVAYVVAKALGVETKSPNYLALYDADHKKILENLQAISDTSRQILDCVSSARAENKIVMEVKA